MDRGNIIGAYDNFYAGLNEQWRLMSARYKAKNIVELCRDKGFTKVLEVGAGDGSILKLLSDQNFSREMHALEISQSGLEQIRARAIQDLKSVQLFDGYEIPFADDEFDLVILSHVLEHVEFERKLLREIRRVAKFVLIEVPRDYRFDADKRFRHFMSYGHINIYTPTSLRFLLKTEGFELVRDKVSIIPPELSKFNRFVNQKKKRTVLSSLKIDAEFLMKRSLMKLGGRRAAEKFANAYTILLKRTTNSGILK